MRERQSPYALAFCLLLAGAIPELAWTEDAGFSANFTAPTPAAAAWGPELARSAVFFPAVAGLLALFLAASMPRWVRGLGFAALGGALLFLPADRAGAAAALNGQFALPARADLLLLGGLAAAFVAARAQADGSPRFVLSLVAAAGGLAVLAWLVLPRPVTPGDSWLGLVSRDHPDTIPVARGFLHNQEFAWGTHPIRYVWWNLSLAALVVFPLLCLRTLTRRPEYRPGAADLAYGCLVFVLLSVALSAVAVAALGDTLRPAYGEGGPVGWPAALVGAANAARLVFPPLLLAGLALAGVSDVLKSAAAVRVPRWSVRPRLPRLFTRRREAVPPPQIPPAPVPASRRPGRVRMVTDAYGGAERI